ncbi:hypothetical protein B0H63DRAFT_282789 [Podospora didyma]|uniref:PH domain-containing protein n=1 Tax=Podospora didyma TaxID=330526 RepID=A0AAE0K9B7_9PEZI|nr:hypothetical protein B0H63DRAFT_282789 [Podospora didyma]
MATSVASDKPVAALVPSDGFDPFVTSPSGQTHLRHSNFDTHLFALSPGTSTEQVKRAIEAHLKDTERRMEEAGKLGTALVQQRKELTDRLREVEGLQSEGELNPDLRTRLVEIEKDYNEVARESARAFLPKQRIPSNEAAQGSPFAPEGKGGRRSVSPSKFESLATGSPTKLSVPNRKLRNQPTNRIHDIEFAAEISTSLISQVRNLQALLSERDEELRDIKSEQSKLEADAESFQQRLKTLDESESRYKDENWNLETQIRDLIATQKEAADREKKLLQTLSVLQADKNAAQRELEEVKDNLAKQDEKHAAATKNLEIELGTTRRNAAIFETERLAMQRKVEELTSQNQELAKAFSLTRGRMSERESGFGMSEDEFQTATDNGTPEHSPPPSPVKGTPRHSVLESETMKTSLGHAQRTIQTLRTNIHREKTEKLELKRMLQDARDELERSRGDPNANRKSRKVDSREFKKPSRLGQLGTARLSRTDLYLDDPEWEDHGDNQSPRSSQSAAGSTLRSMGSVAPIVESSSDHFDTANEASESAFETAHERATETEDFQTGAEEMSDDDAATETEASPSRGAGRTKRPPVLPLNQPGNRYSYSFESTASTSNDEDDYGLSTDLRTPTAQPAQKMRLRVSRGALNRRSRQVSEEPAFQSSPASFVANSVGGTPQQTGQGGQSLFTELGEFEGSDDDSYVGGATPSRRSIRSVTPGSFARGRASPAPEVPALPKVIMVDSGMMTEPVQVKPMLAALETPIESDLATTADQAEEEAEDSLTSPQSVIFRERPMSMDSVIGPRLSHASTQWLGDELRDGEFSRPLSSISYSDASVQHDNDMDAKLAQFPSPPTSPPKFGLFPMPILRPPQTLSMSYIQSEVIEPEVERETPSPPSLTMSSILSLHTEPVLEPEITAPQPPPFSMSPLLSVHVEPQANVEPPLPKPPTLSMPVVLSQHIEPFSEPEPAPPSPITLSFSAIQAEQVQPVEVPVSLPSMVEHQPEAVMAAIPMENPVLVPFTMSSIRSEHVEPQTEPAMSPIRMSFSPINVEGLEPRHEVEKLPLPLSLSSIESQHVEPLHEVQAPPRLSISSIYSEHVEPLEAPATPPPALSLSLSSLQSLEVEPLSPEETVVFPPPLSFSSLQSLETEPVEPRSPKRNAFIIPRDAETDYLNSGHERSQTPPDIMRGRDGVILGDNESTSTQKRISPTIDQGAQTALTAEAIDQILNAKNKPFGLVGVERSNSVTSLGTPSTVRIHRPRQGSIDSPTRSKGRSFEIAVDASETALLRRPGSSGSGRVSLKDVPPLPANHKEVIEAARTGSSSGGQAAIGSMGPPLFPASALRNQSSTLRPRTPNGARRPMSPISVNSVVNSGRGTPTPRLLARNGSVQGAASGLHSPSRMTQRSRKSSVSSFASEIDTRFNMGHEDSFDTHGFGPNTDPRMIQAITQTMIGEYLWKYTRKAGRGEMSGNRHRRYFWVHPYTRTLYWSDRDPSAAGRAELRAKSVPIEAVRVVTDDNPMPPGLHRKSLVIISPGRTIKFTCTTGQRHETWFNALSYLLLRTHNEGHSDAEEMAGHITREDVDEFNPSFGGRPSVGNRAAASLSSYNSRAVRNDSPAIDMSMELPTLTPTPHKKASQGRPPYGTFSRISGYWKDSKVLSGTFGSLRSRSVSGREPNHSIYEASEVQDSAEDLRQIIERQDREADRLENVRACCEGKHDVGTLHGGGSKRGHQSRGHSHTHSHSGASATTTPAGTVRSRA